MESEAEDDESVRAPTPQLVEGEEAKVEEAPEVLVIPLSKRVKIVEDMIQINRLLKSQSLGSDFLRHCIVERLCFEGPDDPMDFPV